MSVVYQVADLFAGAGGTSTGALRAIAARGDLAQLVAVNHWSVAVATHTANHGAATHYCMDISTAEPEHMVPGRRLDLLVASPECVHFSRARGGKPVSDQRRSGADWVLKWLERLDVRVLLVENVKEFMSWGDVENGRPVSQKRGRQFLEWLGKIRALGYTLDFTTLNAANYGDVTTRERFFLIARKDGRPIRWPTPTHSKHGTSDMFGTLPAWRAAREIIDWSDLGPSLLDRAKPLSLKTRMRIARGLQRFGGILAPLFIRLLDLPTENEARFIAGCTGAIVEAFILSRNGHNDPNGRVRPTSDPLATVTSSGSGTGYLVAPVAESFTFGNRNNATPHGVAQPIVTLTTATGGGVYLVSSDAAPFVIGQQSDSAARSTDQPIPTIATGGVIRVATPEARPFLDVYYQTGVADSVNDPLSTATTKPRHALVSPLVVKIDQTHQAGPGVRSVIDPLPTLTTKQSEAMATPFAVPYYGEREGQAERVHDLGEPLPTVTTAGRFALVWPHLSPKFGERAGQDPRAHDIADPLPTVTADGAGRLVSPIALPCEIANVDPRRLVAIDGVLHLLDIKFRMLKNGELAEATGFPPDYQFHGNKSDITKQIGNAVPVNLAAALVAAILDPEQSAELAGAPRSGRRVAL